ncbi:MAG: holo-ACP synthase [Verrucomicrobiae bacterium]|nr:holo-ACP synthase [Verrucomicrobiae bacterium]
MILGVGIDIIEVARIEQSYQRFGERFLQRILRPAEITYCLSFKHPGPHLAARFAAKEAVSKAFGTGIGAQLSWQAIEVERRPSGEPFITLHEEGLVLLATRGGRQVLISLTHTTQYAAAVAILEA